jgi:[protein-PII] uridylyltransferase
VFTQPPSTQPALVFDNASSCKHTILRLEASDRLGLLSDILSALTECNLNIDHALIDTGKETARDLFYLRDANNGKIIDPTQLELVRQRILEAIKS